MSPSKIDGITNGEYVARLLEQTLRDVTKLVGDAAGAGGERRDGAGVTALDAWILDHEHREFFRAVFGQNIETVEQLLGSAEDNAYALLAVLRSGRRPTTSLFVLERAITEALLKVCWLLDGTKAPERTLVRMMVVQADAIEGNLTAAEAFGPAGADDARQARENIAAFHRMLDEHGFVRSPSKRPEISSSVKLGLSSGETARFNVTDAARAYMRLAPWQWHLSSGAAHGHPWMIASMIGTTTKDAAPNAHEDACHAVAGNLFELADALADAASTHTGVDVVWFHKAIHRRRTALTVHQRGNTPSVGYEEYRSRPLTAKRSGPLLSPTFLRRASTDQDDATRDH